MTTTDDELLALARRADQGDWKFWVAPDLRTYIIVEEDGDERSYVAENLIIGPDTGIYIAAANPPAIIAMIERHRAERAEGDAHAGQWKATLDQQCAEVERLTRERDEARQENQYLRDEKAVLDTAIECAHSDELTAVAMQQNAEHLLESAEAALSAAQKRIAELEEGWTRLLRDAAYKRIINARPFAGGTASDGEQVTQHQRGGG